MRKRRFYPLYYRKGNHKKIVLVRFLSVVGIISIGIIFSFIYFFIKSSLYSNKILFTEIKILKNDTTIPDNVIITKIKKNFPTFLTFYKNLKQLETIFPEIDKIKFKFYPFKKLEIMIFSKKPIIQIGKFFYNVSEEKFWCYDNDIVYSRHYIVPVTFDSLPIDYKIKDIVSLYKTLQENTDIKNLKKIHIKQNNEYHLQLINEKNLIIDETFTSIEQKIIRKTIQLCLELNTNIYARLLNSGKLVLTRTW